VISYLRGRTGAPTSVAEIAEECGAFYEEVLHILTTLEALSMVERYSRDGAPKEGPRVAYCWRPLTASEAAELRDSYKKRTLQEAS